MVTVVKTPQGHKIIDQAIEADISDSGGDALITSAYHGLGTGDHVYITSDIDEYNGFWHVTVINVDTFKISEYAGAGYVEYYQDAVIDYYLTQDHVWASIFLPIVYKISNDRWPINSIDNGVAIAVTSNDNDYLEIETYSTIKSPLKALEFVKISGASDESINGVWQIIEVINSGHIVIDMPYTSVSLVGAFVQYYYNNYQVKVKVYAGLPASHPWQAKKPYEEMAELSFTPDENNIAMFSVSDYIRGKIAIKNNLTLFSLPLNLDAFTGYYISIAESYDTSDGYTVGTEESEFMEDDFKGYAVAGKLPFKNTYAGDYADYIYTDSNPALWLTVMDRLLAVEDKYFDISFIKNVSGGFTVQIDKYIADYLITTETVVYADQGIGVYRVPITADATYDSFCITVISSGDPTDITLPALSTWETTTGADEEWTTGASPSVALAGGGSPESSEELYAYYLFVAGAEYTISVDVTITVGILSALRLRILDEDFNILETESDTILGTGVHTITLTFTATSAHRLIALSGTVGAGASSTITVNDKQGTETFNAATLTEEICIDMLESCDAASGFIPTDIRLLEDGSYRILE